MTPTKTHIQKDRMEYAVYRIEDAGFDVCYQDESVFHFEYCGNTIRVFPYKGWFTGVGVVDGRGIENLIKQIGNNWESLENQGLDNKLIKW